MKRERKPIFDPKAFLAKADGGRTISKYQKDQTVFSQGDAADAVFYIQQGKVKITVISEQGKEAVVAILGTGAFFGEGCLTAQSLRMATVTAMMECENHAAGESSHHSRDPRGADICRDVHVTSSD